MRIVWTPEVIATFNSNLDYILNEWGDKVALDFTERTDEVILRIAKNPQLYPSINKLNNLHRCVVVKQVSLYYRIVSNQRIDLITFWNNHQNPERLFFK